MEEWEGWLLIINGGSGRELREGVLNKSTGYADKPSWICQLSKESHEKVQIGYCWREKRVHKRDKTFKQILFPNKIFSLFLTHSLFILNIYFSFSNFHAQI